MPTPAELFARVPLFANLQPQHHDQISTYATRHEYAAGAMLVRQGDTADSLFIIESGTVGVYVRDAKLGVQQLVATLGPSQCVGELALVTGQARNASCSALDTVVAHRLGRDVFYAVLNQAPAVALNLARALGERLAATTQDRDVTWLSLQGRPFDTRLWSMAPDLVWRTHRMVPLELHDRLLTIGMVDPKDAGALDALTRHVPGIQFKVVAVAVEEWQKHIEGEGPKQRSSLVPGGSGAMPDARPQITYLDEDEGRASRPGPGAPTGAQAVNVVTDILSGGLVLGASDIHIEQDRKGMQVRYRVDGALQSAGQPYTIELGKPVISRLKLLAKLDITESRKPQDGRISLKAGSRIIDLRVSTMPAKFGEKVVMRVLDAEGSITDLKGLFVVDKVRQMFTQLVYRPQGLVMVTGPTGSGKTTTLYSALNLRRRPEINCVTVEDPIEYHIDGVTQIQVQNEHGMSFGTALRALLRQDPDVIMVGELRDRETAHMAIEASMTGHLVLTSVHTNGAFEALARLSDLGVESYAIANGLLGVLHQRLVRRVCADCTEAFDYPEPIVSMLYRSGALLANEKPVLQRGRGCPKCNNTGFKGRVALYEMLVVNDAVRDAIASGAELPAVRQIAAQGSMINLPRYAGLMVGMGYTVPGEVIHLVTRALS